MRKGFLLAAILLLLAAWKATAQIPPTLQIAVTNGTATVCSQTSSVAFFGDLETTTNLSPPVVWSGTMSPLLMTSVSSNFPAANAQTFFRLVQAYPIFEFAIFYNLNLEIDPGGGMSIDAPVFSNAGIWAGTANLYFNSTVSAVGQVTITGTDPFATGKTDSSAPPHFNVAGQPTSGVGALNLPGFGITNAEAMLNLPPANYAMGTAAAYSTNGLAYLANAVDLVISNTFTGTNILGGGYTPKGTNLSLYFQDPVNYLALTKLTPDFYILKTPAKTGLYTNYVSPNLSDTNRCYTNVFYAGWSFVTNVAFYDYRESKTVQAVQIDVSKFNIWLTNSTTTNSGFAYNLICDLDKGHPIDSIWVYNTAILSSSQLPAVRIINGKQLPNFCGLTIATPMPIYVYGNYNSQITDSSGVIHVSSGTNTSGTTYPAALMGDAITVLSSNWSDAYTASTSVSSRLTVATTINAACLEGIVQSNGINYSGGEENFLRLMENWFTGLTYNGSIVVMFPSVYATNAWQSSVASGNPTGYYNVPGRFWGFDLNFLQQASLPPLTPQVVNFPMP